MSASSWIRGLSFGLLWYISVLMGFYFIYCPLLILLFINLKWYRLAGDVVIASWEHYPAALLCVMFGGKVYVAGDYMRPHENAILIMNHRTRLDWFFVWVVLLHGAHSAKRPYVGQRCKFVLKSPIRKLPGIGWIMQMACFLYIHRKWETDEVLLARILNYFKDIGNDCKILIFPEGTDLSLNNKKRSNEYARKNNFKEYDKVLHPRTTGFTYIAQQMRKNDQLEAIYDLTVAYPYTLAQTELDIAKGRIPEETHFEIKRYDVSDIPNTSEQLDKWLQQRWCDKETRLAFFYKSKKFHKEQPADFPWPALYFSAVFWTLFNFATIYAIYMSFFVKMWVVFHTILFFVISKYTDGIQHFEISRHYCKSKSQ